MAERIGACGEAERFGIPIHVPASTPLEGGHHRVREWTRMIIAGGLVGLLALGVLSSFWYVKWGLGDSADRDSLLNLFFNPLIGLLSA